MDFDLCANTNKNEFAFRFEVELQNFIVHNLTTIDSGLQLYTDEDVDGVEFKTGVGPIDILAQDIDGGFVVFELKLSRGEDAALGQIQRYMGWVKSNLANGAPVRGVIVAKSISEKLRYAASVANHISLFEYAVTFHIEKAEL